MKLIKFVLCICYLANCFANDEVIGISTPRSSDVSKNIKDVDILLTNLNTEMWIEDDIPCLKEFNKILHNVKNGTLWATWIWDSMHHSPVGVFYGSQYQMGSFEQCLHAPVMLTQYCLVNLKIADYSEQKGPLDPYGEAKEYFKTQSKFGKKFNTIYWALCMPQICRSATVARVAALMLKGTHIVTDSTPQVSVKSCLTHENESTPSESYAGLLATVLSLVISTIFINVRTQEASKKSMVSMVANIFSLKNNWNSLFKEHDGEIKVMNGIRFLSAIGIIFIHGYVAKAMGVTINHLSFEKESQTPIVMYRVHITLVVDTFFFMSGLLLIKGYMSNKNKENLIIALVKRYLRLIGPLVLCVYLTMIGDSFQSPLLGDSIEHEKECCNKNWLWTLLMINVSMLELCISIAWYIACDFQLTIFGTLLYYVYQKNKSTGIIMFYMSVIMSMVIPGCITYFYQLVPLPFARHVGIMKFKNIDYIEHIYIRSYCRAGPYLMGMAAGYFMVLYKPQKRISMKWSILFFTLSLTTMTAVLYLTWMYSVREYSAVESILIAALDRITWSIGVWGVIWFCEYGQVPAVSSFLSWSFFRPLSRLSYGIYLFHLAIASIPLITAQHPLTFQMSLVIIEVCGTVVLSTIISLYVWLTVEAPIINITKQCL